MTEKRRKPAQRQQGTVCINAGPYVWHSVLVFPHFAYCFFAAAIFFEKRRKVIHFTNEGHSTRLHINSSMIIWMKYEILALAFIQYNLYMKYKKLDSEFANYSPSFITWSINI